MEPGVEPWWSAVRLAAAQSKELRVSSPCRTGAAGVNATPGTATRRRGLRAGRAGGGAASVRVRDACVEAAGARVRGGGVRCGLPRRRAARREHGARERCARLAGGTVSSRRTRPGPRGDGAVAAAGARADSGVDPGAEPQTAGARVSAGAGAGECVRGAGRETFFVKLHR